MSDYNLSLLLVIFMGVAAVSLFFQCLALVGLYRASRELSSRLDRVGESTGKKMEVLAEKVEDFVRTAKDLMEGANSLQRNLVSTSEIVQKRVAELDVFAAETTDIARLQVLRIQDVVDSASRRVEETMDTLQKSVLTPVTELHAITRGIKVALDVFLRKRKRPAGTPQDEEMFI